MLKPPRNGNGSIDHEPLKEPERTAFEKSLHAKYQLKGPVLHLLDTLLARYFWGKADCYPSNKGLMEWLTDRHKNTVQRQLQRLRDAGAVRLFADRSLISQRRIVLVDHPNARPIIDSLDANPHVKEMHGFGGVKNDRCRGVKNDRCRGVKAVTPEPLTVEPEELNRNSVGTGGGNFSHLGTVNGKTGGSLAPLAQEVAPLPTESGLGGKELPRPPKCRCAAPLELLGGGTAVRCPQCRAIQIIAPVLAGDPVPISAPVGAPSPPVATSDEFDCQRWAIEQRRRVAAGELVFQAADEMTVVRLLSSLSPGSEEIEVTKIARAVTVLLNDRHSFKNWMSVADLARSKKIPMEAFVGIAGPGNNPAAIVMFRLKPALDLAKSERAAKSKRHAKQKGK